MVPWPVLSATVLGSVTLGKVLTRPLPQFPYLQHEWVMEKIRLVYWLNEFGGWWLSLPGQEGEKLTALQLAIRMHRWPSQQPATQQGIPPEPAPRLSS